MSRLKFKFLHSAPDSSSCSDSDAEEVPQCKVPRLLTSWRSFGPPKPVSLRLIGRPTKRPATQNIVNKFANREHFGKFSSHWNGRSNELPFKTIPDRLRFCLRNIVPYCHLQNHVFMGLTVCGQFLMSFTVSFEEGEEEELTQNYSFTNGYKYKLFFWIYRPNTMLVNFYQVCLFDDHGVDNMKTVSMTQWVNNPRLLVVHGAAESDCENEESYISYVAVPKLGCRECSEIRKSESDENYKTDTLCIRCNLTIHTKYTRTDSDPQLVPHVNFNHPDYLVTVSNGFIHALHIQLEKPPPQQRPMQRSSFYTYQQLNMLNNNPAFMNSPSVSLSQDRTMDEIELCFNSNVEGGGFTDKQQPNSSMDDFDCEGTSGTIKNVRNEAPGDVELNKTEDVSTMVANIIADFAECETKATNSMKGGGGVGTPEKSRIFSRQDRSASNNSDFICPPVATSAQQRLRKENSGGVSSSSQKLDSYEFSEETEERCEKISLFRKKRLADKKYEFSEDNAENIIPFNRIRTRSTATVMRPFLSPGGARGGDGPAVTGAAAFDIPLHAHRASPNYGFRSPCGSPIGNRCLRSPPTFGSRPPSNIMMGRSPTYVTSQQASMLINCHVPPAMSSPSSPSPGGSGGMFSPKHHQYYVKRFNGVPAAYVFSSPKRNCELQEILPANFQNNVPLMPPPPTDATNSAQGVGGVAGDEKPIFSKKVVRRFVEETDAASVITNEEDDCISPGYHTSLPMEVHGSCYSVMQMISEASAQKLNCPIVKITQNSFDMDQFTYYVANHVCEKHNKKYGVFYDWACELVSICKYSGIATCILAVHFTATDKLLASPAILLGRRKGGAAAGGANKSSSFFGGVLVDAEPPLENAVGDGGQNYDCINCSSNQDCVFHRKHYQCSSLFTWDLTTGEWSVLDYGELVEMGKKWRNQNTKKQTTILRARTRKMAMRLRGEVDEGVGGKEKELIADDHLRVLDSSHKSKEALIDLRNCVEFYRGTVATANDLSDLELNNSSDDEDVEEEEEEEDDQEEEDLEDED